MSPRVTPLNLLAAGLVARLVEPAVRGAALFLDQGRSELLETPLRGASPDHLLHRIQEDASRVSIQLSFLRDVLLAMEIPIPFINEIISDLDDVLARLQFDQYLGHSCPNNEQPWQQTVDRVISRLMEIGTRAKAVAQSYLPDSLPPGSVTTSELEERLRQFATTSSQFELASKEKDIIIRRSRRLAEVGMLAAFVAHRFGNIMHVIRARAELINDELARSTSDTNQHLEEIDHACRQGMQVVRTLRNYAKPHEPQLEPFSLRDLIAEVVSFLEALFPAKLLVYVEVSPDLPLMVADRGMFHEILVNLCFNAMDAMGHEGSLRLTAQRIVVDPDFSWQHPPLQTGPAVQIMVQDTGPGITPEILPNLFRPFVTTKPNKGTGLGLLIAKQHVERHFGWIGGRNLPDGGACFTIILPI